MKRFVIIFLLSIPLFSDELNWERVNSCPVGNMAFVEEVLSEMTLEEKVGQTIMADLDFIKPSDLKRYPIGGILNGGNTSPNGNQRASTNEWKRLAQDFYDESTNSGADIPILWGTDAVHGHSNVFGATIFPHNIGLGASANEKLLEDIGAAVAEEVLATGLYWTFAPTVTVPQDYRWGRTYEGYSESPELVSKLGEAFIYGLQGRGDQFLAPNKIIGTAKHFLGDGGTYLGVDQGDTKVSENILKDIHGTPYYSALDACIQTVMASFNSWNGSKVHGNEYLLTEVLKNQMGFDGFVVGDWNGHGQIPGCSNGSCPESLIAGVDMYMVPENWKDLYRNTLRQAENGDIPIERLDDAVRRILIVKERLGLFEGKKPSNSPFSEVGLQHNRDISRQAVRESLVLLKNNENVLPIKQGKKVLVIGPDADSLRTQTGGWTLDWQGTNNQNKDFPNSITFLDALKEEVGAENVTHVQFLNSVNAEDYDVAIVAYGEQPYAEGVGDRSNLNFSSKRHIAFLELLAENKIPTVSLFFTGRPLWVTKEINLSDAFVVAWLPGTESRGMTDVLVNGDKTNYDFTGKLPFSWPKNTYQANLNYYDATSDPLFAYGYGLTYEDNVSVPNLDEGEINANEQLPKIELLKGTISENFIGYIQESNLQQVQISSNKVSSQNDIVKVDLIDVNKQDDTLKLKITESDYLNSFLLLSKEILNLRSFDDGYINLRARVNETNEDIKYLISCGIGCTPVLDLSEFLTKSDTFIDYSLPIKCFSNNSSLDLSKVNLPLYIATKGPLDLDLMNVEIGREKGEKVLECY
jgi:beta-glucosidase